MHKSQRARDISKLRSAIAAYESITLPRPLVEQDQECVNRIEAFIYLKTRQVFDGLITMI